MKNLFPILLLCALLLVGCGKKDAETAGSGSAETVTEQTASGKKSPSASKADQAKTTAAPAQETAAATSAPSAAGTGGKSGANETPKPASADNPTVPDPTPTPKIEDWDDADEAQQQLLDIISVNPVGNWMDKTTGAMMVIDGDFRGSILITRQDGSSTVWTFTGDYDPMTGVLSYTDGAKQTVGQDGMKTDYENSAGSLVVKDGALVWTDAHEKTTITFARDES